MPEMQPKPQYARAEGKEVLAARLLHIEGCYGTVRENETFKHGRIVKRIFLCKLLNPVTTLT